MPDESEPAAPKTLTINYLKSNGFREVACDGALGGPTPNGSLWLAFYTERFPLPRKVRHKLTEIDDGDACIIDSESPAETLEGLVGIVRNVEFGLYMSVETAEQLHAWLGRSIKALKNERDG